MNIADFWQIIDKARTSADSWEDMHDPLVALLAELETADLMLWKQVFDEYQRLSYKDKLWAAAYVINGGCSDDGFDYFRGWLTAQGKKIFLNALADPESLADVESCTEGVEYEDILGAASDAFFQKYGLSRDYNVFHHKLDEYPLPEQLKAAMASEIRYAADIDVEWDDADLPKLLPKLCQTFDWE
jgi:hypothetical protein